MNLSRFFAAFSISEKFFVHAFLYIMRNLFSLIGFHKDHNTISLPKYLKVLLIPLMVLLFSAASLATHNPTVSHSADSVTNGTLQDNSELEAKI